MNPNQAYAELTKSLREIALLGSINSVLHWDERTVRPPAGAEHRAAQISLLATMTHGKFTSPRIGELLAACEQSDLVKDPTSDAAVNVHHTRKAYDRATKLPPKLVEEMAKTTSLAENAWEG